MAIPERHRYTKQEVYRLLTDATGKTLGEVDANGANCFEKTKTHPKITGIAGDVVEQSIFGYPPNGIQGCDIIVDGQTVEVKATGVRVPKTSLKHTIGKTGDAYNVYLKAKEGITITAMTLEPTIQYDFYTSHFWEKAEHLLIVFYEYKSYNVVPASGYADFPIVGYCWNKFTPTEQSQLKNDWEIIRDYLAPYYKDYPIPEIRREKLDGFTSVLRPRLLLLELSPKYTKSKKSTKGAYQKPRYRLKQTFANTIVQGHFDKSRSVHEVDLKESFSSFAELDKRCHELTLKYGGKTFPELKELLNISTGINTKDFAAKCILKMFEADCSRLNQIKDFIRAGIEARTIVLNTKGKHTEDMKFHLIDFDEWSNRDVDFEESDVFQFFMEHSLLCPIFREYDSKDHSKTVFEGFKRFAFDDDFINTEVRRMWEDSRRLIHTDSLVWEYVYDKEGNRIRNASGSWKGAPNFPKKKDYTVFFRGGAQDSSDASRTTVVNEIRMVPQFFWIRGDYIANKILTLPYL